MATQQDVFKAIQDIKDKIIEKGGVIQQENINVSLPELVAGVESIPTGGGGGYEIITAERPNYTIKVQDETGRDVTTGNTGLEGGAVTLSVSKTGSYTVKAFSGDVEAWSNTVNIEQSGVYNVKSGLPLENYTEDEIKAAANGHYAKYMWNLWDSKKMESFMGSADEQYCTAYIIDFDKDNRVDGGGKAGITWLIPTISARYNHKASGGSTTNNNGISWIGSLIKQNCMKVGEETYVYDNTATAASEGDYYE